MDNQFIDVKKWLQENLDAILPNHFRVSNERALDSDFEGEVVVSALSGTPYEDSANIPYQIDVFTSEIDTVMNALNILAKTSSNVSFTQLVKIGKDNEDNEINALHKITPYISTPVVMEKDIQNGAQHFVKIVVFVTFLVLYDVNDISDLEIDGEKINLLQSSINYTAEMISNRVSGQQLNKSKKKASTVSINFTMVNKNSTFGNKAFEVMFGQSSGNTKFVTKVTMNNGKTATVNMFIGNASIGSNRGQLPSLNVALYLYDDRGDVNNA